MTRQRHSGVGGVADGPVEQWLRETDGLPGGRAALPRGTLPGPPPDPQGDENRDPPPVTESGAGPYRRTVDLGQNTVTPSGNRQRSGFVERTEAGLTAGE